MKKKNTVYKTLDHKRIHRGGGRSQKTKTWYEAICLEYVWWRGNLAQDSRIQDHELVRRFGTNRALISLISHRN